MANNDKENKIKKFTKEAIGKTLNQFNKEIGIADLVEINKNQDRILNGILSQVNDENTEKTEKSNIITLDNSTDGIVELKEIQGDTNVNVSKIEEMPITHDIGEKEGNVFTLNEIPKGAISIGEIQGNTMVNCNKDDKKELILMEDLSTEGYSNITLNKGVNGGLVDVALEGNTMVNVCDQKDPVAITKSYTVETGNHVALQGEYDGKCRPVVTGNTLVNLVKNGNIPYTITSSSSDYTRYIAKYNYACSIKSNTDYTVIFKANNIVGLPDYNNFAISLDGGNSADSFSTLTNGINVRKISNSSSNELNQLWAYFEVGTDTSADISDVIILEGDYTNKPIPGYFEGLQSSFEDKVVTQEMVDTGEELADNLGKYKVDYVISKEDATVGQTKTFYLNSPLLEGDTIEQQGDDVVHVHRYGKVVLDGSSDEGWGDRGTGNLDSSVWHRYSIKINDMKNLSENIICDKLSYAPYDTETIGWQTGSGQSFIIQNKLSAYATQDVAGFKQYLQQNPTTVVYELATPQYEVISTNDTILCDSYVNGYLDVDSVVPIEKVDFKRPSISLKYLYPSTKYTIQFEADNTGVSRIAIGGDLIYDGLITTGVNRFQLDYTNYENPHLFLNGIGFNASNIVVTEATDQEFGYFEGMKSVGECEDLEIVSSNSDGTLSNTQTLTHEPLRAVGNVKDRYVLIDGKWYIERNCGVRAYQEGDKDNYITDMVNTVYPLSTPTYEPIDYNPFEVYSDVTHISNNSTIPCNMTIKNTGYNCLLKPDTTYTVSSNRGINTVTTGANIEDSCLRFYNEDTSNVATMKNVLLLEGDWTSKADLIPCNFSGIESCFEQELVTDENDEHYGKYKVTAKVVGKNLFNINQDFTLGYINHETGEISLANRSRNFVKNNTGFSVEVVSPYGGVVTDFIRVSSNTTYKFSATDTGNFAQQTNICFYDCNKRIISGLVEVNLYAKFNTPKDCCYIRAGFWLYSTPKTISYTNIQLEEGDTATSYEPYKESNVTFYVDKPLRGVGDSKDRIFIQGDKVVVERKCGSATFDGSADEDIEGIYGSIYSNKCLYNAKISKLGVQGTNLKSNTLNTSKGATEYYDEGIYLFDNYIRFIINADRLNNIYTTKSFKQWLQQNPTTVVYQLASPVYEEVEYSSNRLILNTFNNESFNNSTLFLDTNISPKLSFKPLWEELVYVKNSTKYYIQFNAVGSGEVVINLGGTELTTEIVEGYNCIPITTPSESTNLMTMIGQGITISEVVVSEVICGGYYKGLQSCFEEHMENGKYRILLRGIALDGSKVNGIKLYINEPLRGVEDTKDRLCIKNGKLMVERKCGSAIFDGSDDEGWKHENIRFSISISNVVPGKFSKAINNAFFTTDYIATGNQYDSYIIINGWNGTNKLFLRDINKFTTLAELKQYLQQNPLTIVYKAYKPIYEEVTNEYGLPIVFEGYENGIVYIDSAVTPTTHIKYTSNNQLATTLSEAEEQNISTQEDINMNVITYMMDIDMMLTDMEMSNDISVMAVRRDNSNENMLDRMSDEDKKVYRDNTVVMLEKMITAKVLEKEDIEGRINMYYDKNRISKEQYKYLKSLL